MNENAVPKPDRALIQRILSSGAHAGLAALRGGHQVLAGGVASNVERMRTANAEASVDELKTRVIRAHLILARSEGAAAGIATSTAEATTIIGSAGTLTVPAAVVITATDLTGLAWIQLRMVLMIAALSGHDPLDPARLQEFLSLQGATPPTAAPAAALPLTAGAIRVATRLLERYLRGPLLAALKSLFSAVGIKFARAALIRQLFLLNIPVNIFVNDAATRRLAQKARAYYGTLPPTSTVRVEP